MIRKAADRWRLMVLVSALVGVTAGVFGAHTVSLAQSCLDGYETCSPDWFAIDPSGYEGTEIGGGGCDNAGGKWVCPLKEVGSTGTSGGKCTSRGCKKYSSDGVWVCAFEPSDAQTKCPPLEECDCR